MTLSGRESGAAAPTTRTFALAALAMIAFAANSILTRLALAPGAQSIDPMGFALLRAVSGAVSLCALLALRDGADALASGVRRHLDIRAVGGLFAYFLGFTLAYAWLATGTGALILFGCVQITMLTAALMGGERFSGLGWAGFCLAGAGVVVLLSPGAAAPDPIGAALMIVAGVGWGVYSLRGVGAADPLGATASNFVICAPLVIAAAAAASAAGVPLGAGSDQGWTVFGVLLACVSGALASAGGYVIWYAASPGLGAGRAAATQLSVPVLAALGGVAFLAEPIDARLALASAATLGGVALVLASRVRRRE